MLAKTSSVLLVEDNPDDQFLFKNAWALAEIPNPLMMVADGQEACDYLSGTEKFADRSRFPFPPLLVSDIKMPGMSGIELLEWIRGNDKFKHLPVILFTASTSPSDVAQAYRHCVNSFVIKPSSAQELVEFVAAIKSYWLRFNEFQIK